MTTTPGQHSAAAESARESARNPDGKFGVQPMSEAGDIDLSPAGDGTVGDTGLSTKEIEEALGRPLASLDSRQRALLTQCLLSPAADGDSGADGHDLLDEYESYGPDADLDYPQSIATRVAAFRESETGEKAFFTYVGSPGDSFSGFETSVYCGPEVGFLANDHDIKYLDPSRHADANDEPGLRQALVLAEWLDDDFTLISRRVDRLGLRNAPDVDVTPVNLADAVRRTDENGRLKTRVSVDADEFLSRGTSMAEDAAGESRHDYLAARQMEGGEAYGLGYRVVGVEPSGTDAPGRLVVEVDNDMREWLNNDGWGVESALTPDYKAEIIKSYDENPRGQA